MNLNKKDPVEHYFLTGKQALSLSGIESLCSLVKKFFPFHRSHTGKGIDQTFDLLGTLVPLTVDPVPSGTQVGDWTVPDQWDFEQAWIEDSQGNRIVDSESCNLHIFNGSVPVDRKMDFSELEPHLSVHPKLPGAVHYRTAFFQDSWGFSVTSDQFQRLKEAGRDLRVRVSAKLEPGKMPIGQSYLPGQSGEDLLIWIHTCHPSLAEDNLSSLAVAVGLIRWLEKVPNRTHGYRFVFGPATIGPIAWWYRNQDKIRNRQGKKKIRQGLVLSLLGGSQAKNYKLSESGETFFDRWFQERDGVDCLAFEPWGYDERQWNSPGIKIPTGRFTRNLPGEFDQYHSSEDTLEFVSEEVLTSSLELLVEAISAWENNRVPINLFPYGEPQLGRRKLYQGYGQSGGIDPNLQKAVQWILNQGDGCSDLQDIAARAKVEFPVLVGAFDLLFSNQLVKDGGQKSTKPLF